MASGKKKGTGKKKEKGDTGNPEGNCPLFYQEIGTTPAEIEILLKKKVKVMEKEACVDFTRGKLPESLKPAPGSKRIVR